MSRSGTGAIESNQMKGGLMTDKRSGYLKILAVVILSGGLTGCSLIKSLIGEGGLQKPTVRFEGARLTGLSFDAADLIFSLNVNNPNNLGARLESFDYSLDIDQTAFLKGTQEKGLDIPAKGGSQIDLPLTIRYVDLYKTYKNLTSRDSSDYTLKCTFAFRVPVLGIVQVPVQKSGGLPLLKIPKVQLRSLKLNHLGFDGADLQLQVEINNPNSLAFTMNDLDYHFSVNGKEWANGKTAAGQALQKNGAQVLTIPLSLNFLQMGTTIASLLRQSQPLDYKLQGSLKLNSPLSVMKNVQLPFDHDGEIRITR